MMMMMMIIVSDNDTELVSNGYNPCMCAVVDNTVLELARVSSSRARLLHEQMCSVRRAGGAGDILNRAHCSATAGERHAKQVCNAVTTQEESQLLS